MLSDNRGRRKYLSPAERAAFAAVSSELSETHATFCLTIALTGCRLSEALELTVCQIDIAESVIAFRSLKKRRKDVFRIVPIPSSHLARLIETHALSSAEPSTRLWPWGRTTGWSRVKLAMRLAGIVGPHASPKGLRHGFGIAAVRQNVPLTVLKKWLGHSTIEMTARYADAVGEEERLFAQRMWDDR